MTELKLALIGLAHDRLVLELDLAIALEAAQLELRRLGGVRPYALPNPEAPRRVLRVSSTDGKGAARARRIGYWLALVLGTLCLLLGIGVAYAWSIFGDGPTVADKAAAAAEDERVQEAVAVAVTDAILDEKPELVAVRPAILEASRVASGSKAFIALVFASTLQVHELIVDQGELRLAIDLSGMGTLVATVSRDASVDPGRVARVGALVDELGQERERLREAEASGSIQALREIRELLRELLSELNEAVSDPSLAEEIPQQLEFGAVLVTENGLVIDLIANQRLMTALSWGLPLGGLLLLGLSVWLSDRRPRAVRRAGIAIALSGLGFLLAVVLLRAQVLSAISDELRRNATAGVLEPFLNGVKWWGIVIAGGGALLAYWSHRQVETEVTPAAQTPEGELGRLGVFRRHGLVGLFVAGGLVLALGLIVTRAVGGGGSIPIEECNGSGALCDRPLDTIAFPTSHNAMGAADAAFFRPSQRIDIVPQLDAGIRGLQLDSYYGEPTDGAVRTVFLGPDTEFLQEAQDRALAAVASAQDVLVGDATGPPVPHLCHDACELGATLMVDALRQIRQWLDGHPTEVLILVFQDYVSPDDTQEVFAASGLLDLTYVYEPGAAPPTPRELLEAGTPVLVMAENQGLGPATWYPNAYDTLLEETPFLFSEVSELESPTSCEPNRGGTGKPLFLLNHWITSAVPSPSDAEVVNERDFVLKRAGMCAGERGKTPNLIAVDFIEIGDVFGAAEELNELD